MIECWGGVEVDSDAWATNVRSSTDPTQSIAALRITVTGMITTTVPSGARAIGSFAIDTDAIDAHGRSVRRASHAGMESGGE